MRWCGKFNIFPRGFVRELRDRRLPGTLEYCDASWDETMWTRKPFESNVWKVGRSTSIGWMNFLGKSSWKLKNWWKSMPAVDLETQSFIVRRLTSGFTEQLISLMMKHFMNWNSPFWPTNFSRLASAGKVPSSVLLNCPHSSPAEGPNSHQFVVYLNSSHEKVPHQAKPLHHLQIQPDIECENLRLWQNSLLKILSIVLASSACPKPKSRSDRQKFLF